MSNALFSVAAMRYLWGLPVVPTAKEFADWIENHPGRPSDWEILVKRLREWPGHRAYPPLPDDETLKHGTRKPLSGEWWTPGAKPGQLMAYHADLLSATEHLTGEPPAP